MPDINREQELQKVAYHLSMEYQASDHWGLVEQLRDFRLFRRGGKGRIRHLLRKQDGLMQFDIRIFDYRYVVRTHNSSRAVNQTVFLVQSGQLGLPQMLMQPESFFHKVGELLGFEDIDFVEHPKFSGQYRLTGEDEDFIRYHFTEDVLHFFTLEKGWTMEGLGYFLLLYKKNVILPPKEIEAFFRRGLQVYQLLIKDPL